MKCVECARIREMTKRAIEKGLAHAARLAGLRRGENPDAKAEDIAEQAVGATAQAGPAANRGQAGDTGAPHRKRRVAKAKGAGPAA